MTPDKIEKIEKALSLLLGCVRAKASEHPSPGINSMLLIAIKVLQEMLRLIYEEQNNK